MNGQLTELGEKLNLCKMGFLKAEIFHDLENKEIDAPFLTSTCVERANPFLIMENAKSIIVYTASYNNEVKDSNLSKYAMGMDYHLVMRSKAESIIDFLNKNGYKGISFCDNGPLNERFLAAKCGIGYIGKNGFLYDVDYGSYVFIGYIVTDCPLAPNNSVKSMCRSCNKCVDACPTGALSSHGYNPFLCLSYITQKKGELNQREHEQIKASGFVYGCDKCQQVCPNNRNLPISPIREFTDNLIADLKHEDISGREFKRKYHDRAFSWRGKGIIERNLSIVDGKGHKN